MAGRRAKSSTAYASALKYLRAGSALLTPETWHRNYPLVFGNEYVMAECELLTADKVSAESRLLQLSQRASSRHDFCVATRLRLTLYTAMDRMDLAVDVFLDWLRREGTVWTSHPSRDDVMREYDRIWDYAWQHFVDHEHGAWYRILAPDNAKVTDEKSPAGKTDYHTMGACQDVLAALRIQPPAKDAA
jgi:hypothetical protein